MSSFKDRSIYPFFDELREYKTSIKEEILNVEELIIKKDPHLVVPRYQNKQSEIDKGIGWNPMFVFAIQGYSLRDFHQKYQFHPGRENASNNEIDEYMDKEEERLNKYVPKTTDIFKAFFNEHNDVVINISVFRLEGNGSFLPLHTNYDPHMYRCHLGILVPEGELGLSVAGEIKKWKEGEYFIFDSMQPHMVWNKTISTRYIINMDCFRPEPELADVRAVQKALLDSRMSRNKFSYGYSGGTPSITLHDHIRYEYSLHNTTMPEPGNK